MPRSVSDWFGRDKEKSWINGEIVMNKILKINLLFILFFMIISITNICYGKSYSIDDMNIEATILDDGSVSVKQTIEYNFKGQYNGIYIDIPTEIDSKEYDSYRTQGELKDSLYINSGVEIIKISQGLNEFSKVSYAQIGDSNVYTTAIENGFKKLKIFSPSIDEKKSFEIEYILKNVCVKHEDVGEFYWNFIGGNWEVPINKLNVDVYLDASNTDLKIWGHGNYNGFSQIISNNHASFVTKDVRKGEYVAVRMAFDLNCIPNCNKFSGITAKALIMQDEDKIGENIESKKAHNKRTAFFCVILTMYWIILLFMKLIKKVLYQILMKMNYLINIIR